ncbi:hypothetical protein KBC75_00780 [Candidatus Shapirobacteria bacterium]|nr:hypothetical protein [Candidatus Shapirobacteria bacterium]
MVSLRDGVDKLKILFSKKKDKPAVEASVDTVKTAESHFRKSYPTPETYTADDGSGSKFQFVIGEKGAWEFTREDKETNYHRHSRMAYIPNNQDPSLGGVLEFSMPSRSSDQLATARMEINPSKENRYDPREYTAFEDIKIEQVVREYGRAEERTTYFGSVGNDHSIIDFPNSSEAVAIAQAEISFLDASEEFTTTVTLEELGIPLPNWTIDFHFAPLLHSSEAEYLNENGIVTQKYFPKTLERNGYRLGDKSHQEEPTFDNHPPELHLARTMLLLKVESELADRMPIATTSPSNTLISGVNLDSHSLSVTRMTGVRSDLKTAVADLQKVIELARSSADFANHPVASLDISDLVDSPPSDPGTLFNSLKDKISQLNWSETLTSQGDPVAKYVEAITEKAKQDHTPKVLGESSELPQSVFGPILDANLETESFKLIMETLGKEIISKKWHPQASESTAPEEPVVTTSMSADDLAFDKKHLDERLHTDEDE